MSVNVASSACRSELASMEGPLWKRGAEMRWYVSDFTLDVRQCALLEKESPAAEPLVSRKLSSWARLSAGADEADEASVPQDAGSALARTLSLRVQKNGAEGAGVEWGGDEVAASMGFFCLRVSGSGGELWLLAARTAALAEQWFAAIDATVEVPPTVDAGGGEDEDESKAGSGAAAQQSAATEPPSAPKSSFDKKQMAGFGPKKKSMAKLLGRKSMVKRPSAGGDGFAGQAPLELGLLVERKKKKYFAIDRRHVIPVLVDFADAAMTLPAVDAALRASEAPNPVKEGVGQVGQRVLFGHSTVQESKARPDAIELSTGGEAVCLICDKDQRARLVEKLREAISDGVEQLQRARERGVPVVRALTEKMEQMGILVKRSQSGKSWQRRHFAIDWSAPQNPVLRSFKSFEELKGRAAESKDVAIVAGSHVTVSAISKRRFCVQLWTPGHRLFVQASSAQHQRQIFERLDKVCYDCQLADDDARQEHAHPFHQVAGKEFCLWLPNSFSATCMAARCDAVLTFKNRQHCRACGCLFCSNCASARLLLPPSYNYGSSPQRVCDSCCLLVGSQQIEGPDDALRMRNAAAHVEDTGPDLPPELAAHYKALGLAPGATVAEVRAAYRRVAKKHHPDRASARKCSDPADTAAFEAVILAREAIEESLEADYGAATGGETATEELAANRACEICQRPFGLGLRRHHCRRCGLAVCNSCSPSIGWKPLHSLGRADDVRHCTQCTEKGELEPIVLCFATAHDAFLSRLSMHIDVNCVAREDVEVARKDAEIVAAELMCMSDQAIVEETGAPEECTALALYDETRESGSLPTIPLALRRAPSRKSQQLALRPNSWDCGSDPSLGSSRSFLQPRQVFGSQYFMVSLSYATEVPDASEEDVASLNEYSTHVYRRFSHFQWLRTKLLEAGHPPQRLPHFPGQYNRLWSNRDEHNDRRANELAIFLRGILLHPLLQEEPAFKLFVGAWVSGVGGRGACGIRVGRAQRCDLLPRPCPNLNQPNTHCPTPPPHCAPFRTVSSQAFPTPSSIA